MLLGSVPQGFYETVEVCDDYRPAFIRGVLLRSEQYNAMDMRQRLAMESFPRWTLYIGPVTSRYQAIKWNDHIFIWASQNKLTWLTYGLPCIVPSRDLPWPYTEPKWLWIYEQRAPQPVVKRWVGNQYSYFYQDGTPVYA